MLAAATANGWQLTAAGRAITHGQLPNQVQDADGTIRGGGILAVLSNGKSANLDAIRQASASATSNPGSNRTVQSAKAPLRAHTSTIFMNCGVGQQGNVNYYYEPYSYTHTEWEFFNFATGAHGTTSSVVTYCPGNGGCLLYHYIKPASPWYVWSATEWGLVSPLNAYCGG
jgi:hypothetical protein